MSEEAAPKPALKTGVPADTEGCIAVWVEACAERDGQAFPGVADRARPKFDDSVAWFLAGPPENIDGFVLATGPGSGMVTDPEGAAVVALLAVAPGRQTRGLGRALLRAVTDRLADLGYEEAVLHALVDNTQAVRLYESEGWAAVGPEYEHTLLKRPLRTFARSLI
jgi:ribosomal protein S18 acetylase RimI-like enzyme